MRKSGALIHTSSGMHPTLSADVDPWLINDCRPERWLAKELPRGVEELPSVHSLGVGVGQLLSVTTY